MLLATTMALAFLLLPDVWAEAMVLGIAVAVKRPLGVTATLFDQVMLVGVLTLLCFLGFSLLAEVMR